MLTDLQFMNPSKARQVFTELMSALFVLLFIYTAIMKLKNIPAFQANMQQVDFIRPFAGFLSIAVPVTELLIAVFLVNPKWRYTGLLASTLLMLAFTVYMATMLLTQSDLPCSCGGVISGMTWPQHLVFNLAFLVGGAAAIFFYHKNIAINRRSRIPET